MMPPEDIVSDAPEPAEGQVLAVHLGHSTNCSSIGSVIDFLFVSSVVAASTIAAVSVLVGAARTAAPEPGTPEAEPAPERPEGDDDDA